MSQSMPNDLATLGHVFNEANKGLLTLQLAKQRVAKIFQADADQFVADLISITKRIIVLAEPSERLMRLIATVALAIYHNEQQPQTEPLITLIDFLTQHADCKEKTVRFNCCQLLHMALQKLENPENLGSETVEKIVVALRERAQDKETKVRSLALQILSLFQSKIPNNEEVSLFLLSIIQTELAKDVRRIAIGALEPNADTIAKFVLRTRDVCDESRAQVFRTLTNFPFSQLSAKQVKRLIDDGLADTEPNVVKACMAMINAWVRDHSIFEILEHFGLTKNIPTAELLLKKLFQQGQTKQQQQQHNQIVNFDEWDLNTKTMTLAEAVCWKCYMKHLKTRDLFRFEDKAPTLSELLEILERHTSKSMIVYQMLEVARLLDLSDETGRKKLSAFVITTIRGSSRVPSANYIDTLHYLHQNEAEFMKVMMEALANTIEPLDKYDQLEGISDPTDTAVYEKALSLIEAILKYASKLESHPGLSRLLQFITPAIQSVRTSLRRLGLQCLALFSLIDTQNSLNYLLLFVQAVKNDESNIQITASRAIFDLVAQKGVDGITRLEESWPKEYKRHPKFPKPETALDVSEVASFTLSTMVSCLSNPSPDMRFLVAEGISKLFLSNAIEDHQILSILVLVFFHSESESDAQTRQCLDKFFTDFSTSDLHHKSILAKALIPVVKRFLGVKKLSSTHQNECKKVIEFVMEHIRKPTRDHPRIPKGLLCHNEIAIDVINEMIDCPAQEPFLMKILTVLEINFQGDNMPIMKARCSKLLKTCQDKGTIKRLYTKIRASVISDSASTSTTSSTSSVENAPIEVNKPSRKRKSFPLDAPKTTGQKPARRKKAKESETSHRKQHAGPEEIDDEEDQDDEREERDAPPKKRLCVRSPSPVAKTRTRKSLPEKKTALDLSKEPPVKKAAAAGTVDESDFDQLKKYYFEVDNFELKTVSDKKSAIPKDRPTKTTSRTSATSTTTTTANSVPKSKKRLEHPTDTSPPAKRTAFSSDHGNTSVVLAFSGFSNAHEVYNSQMLGSLIKKGQEMGAKVIVSREISPEVTHVVIPRGVRTVKTIEASLTCRWIVSPEWIEESHKIGDFLPESPFGIKNDTNPLVQKRIFASKNFYNDLPSSVPRELFHTLVTGIGEASISSSAREADFVLVSRETSATMSVAAKQVALNWDSFFDMIAPW